MTEDQLTVLIIKYLKENKKGAIEKVIDELQPYDIAQLYRNLPEKHHFKFLVYLSPQQIADLIQELESDLQIEILHRLGIEKSSKVMNLMENDDLADLLSELSVEKIQEYLSTMKIEDSTYVQNLMSYAPETAGGLMTNQFVWIKDDYTIRDAVDKLKAFAEMNHTIYYLYVINDLKELVGVVSYRDLLLGDLHEKISDIMFNRVISVPVDLDQEEVAQLIERYDFVAVPVVDENKKLLGIVTVDDVIDVVIQEANEDIEKLSASGKDIDFYTKATTASFRRLPWLILLLFIGLISGSIISGFEHTLEQFVALVFFMPMIAGMTGNTGTQSLAVVVRGLISHDLDRKTVIGLIARECGVGIIIGLTCGILIALIAFVWLGPIYSIVVGGSLVLTLIIGTLAGTIIPLVLYRFGIDPAIASGPLITTLNDIFSLIVYFSFATAFLAYL
ncbi:magnesium transporter [Anaerobacillus isosaccharinicus]|uniref:Magnesium transporter MgtE n=1 Tax=Anaerobacillus isosaccharinicus TaxID=1532552 RepID=A0A1S2MFV9_9BACI|nr:magnesium transporter [Anaerobacillus isosaccharinicus]MBA5588845.1 magnesium transporter [Anaerobacillus isosaccharinicus]QOY37766.1 magnesium transporter [Anaerobacillus isosaccharinicus]